MIAEAGLIIGEKRGRCHNPSRKPQNARNLPARKGWVIEQASIQVSTVGDRPVVEVAGELDLATSPALRQVIDSVLEEGHPDLVVDLGGVTFMDSSAINVLAAVVKRLGPSEVRIAVCRPNLLRLFELSGLDAVLRLYDTVDAALGDVP